MNTRDRRIAFMMACQVGHKDVVQLLLSDPTIELNATCHSGWTL